ncbi:inositol transporter-like SP family MFS transporter [Kibdelosporangium banguiense]|uniref:Inositol transporter-like SP family MFS transporter n=1 Tax=Kibdelosporangium banguiense TaxID=1365924 RepID=A0ABS4TQH0_9PSEU|nr:MFS transporter [Kibdelosporangium banguiense]MBP2326652.1 inositol transporter-like SP family MFS transporter [Kibdelosporangium banguiense]
MSGATQRANRPWKTATLAGMASYLDSGALVTSGIAIGGSYAGALGLDAGTIGALLGLQTLMFAAGALVGGRLGDRFGRRRIFSLSLVLYAAGIALLLIAASTGLLYLGVIAVGFAIGADLPVSLALINEEAPEGKKGRLVVYSGMLWLAGIVAVVVLSSIVGSWGVLGGRIMFAHLLGVAVIVLILRMTLRESAEWAAARQAVDTHVDTERVHFSRVGQLFRPPVLFAVVATGLYYASWNLGASTLGSFGTYLWTTLTGGGVAEFSQLTLLGLPVGFVAGLIFMRAIDRPSRNFWFVGGSILILVAWALPALLGPSRFTLVAVLLVSGLGNAFAGESIYKVWSQELVPTLLRSTSSGLTMAFTRVIAGLAAFGTPALAAANPRLLFALLFGFTLVATVIGLFWVPKLPKASQIEQPLVTGKSSTSNSESLRAEMS